MLDWLIIGGGVHGVHHALNLLTVHRVPRETLRILDPYPQLLTRWTECTTNTGMGFLRSPLVHNLDPAPFALRHFARDEWKQPRVRDHFLGPYKRPSLEVFGAHVAHLRRRHRLEELHVRAAATGMLECTDGIRVETTAGSMEARRVLLAIGMSDQPDWPEWARDLRREGAAVDHVFNPGFRRPPIRGGGRGEGRGDPGGPGGARHRLPLPAPRRSLAGHGHPTAAAALRSLRLSADRPDAALGAGHLCDRPARRTGDRARCPQHHWRPARFRAPPSCRLRRTDAELDVVVVGAGAAGVEMGVVLRDLGVEHFLLLERDQVGASCLQWPAG